MSGLDKKEQKCAARAPQSQKDVVKCDVHKEDENTNKPDVKNCPGSDVLEKEVTKQETTPSHDVHKKLLMRRVTKSFCM